MDHDMSDSESTASTVAAARRKGGGSKGGPPGGMAGLDSRGNASFRGSGRRDINEMHAAATAAMAMGPGGDMYGGRMDSAGSRVGTPQGGGGVKGGYGLHPQQQPQQRQSHLGSNMSINPQLAERFSASNSRGPQGSKGGAARQHASPPQAHMDGGYGGGRTSSMASGQPVLYQTNAALAGANKLSRAPSRGDPWQGGGGQGQAGRPSMPPLPPGQPRLSGHWEEEGSVNSSMMLRASAEEMQGRPYSRGMMQAGGKQFEPTFGNQQMWPNVNLGMQQRNRGNY